MAFSGFGRATRQMSPAELAAHNARMAAQREELRAAEAAAEAQRAFFMSLPITDPRSPRYNPGLYNPNSFIKRGIPDDGWGSFGEFVGINELNWLQGEHVALAALVAAGAAIAAGGAAGAGSAAAAEVAGEVAVSEVVTADMLGLSTAADIAAVEASLAAPVTAVGGAVVAQPTLMPPAVPEVDPTFGGVLVEQAPGIYVAPAAPSAAAPTVAELAQRAAPYAERAKSALRSLFQSAPDQGAPTPGQSRPAAIPPGFILAALAVAFLVTR